MPIPELDLDYLQERINNLKFKNECSTEFGILFIECLMKRHGLQECIQTASEIEGIPDEILRAIKSGRIPSREDIGIMTMDAQRNLYLCLMWICGLGEMIELGADDDSEDGGPSSLEIVINMRELGESEYIASYIVACLILLMNKLPSGDLIMTLTNNFDSSPEQIEKSRKLLQELMESILTRYMQDLEYV